MHGIPHGCSEKTLHVAASRQVPTGCASETEASLFIITTTSTSFPEIKPRSSNVAVPHKKPERTNKKVRSQQLSLSRLMLEEESRCYHDTHTCSCASSTTPSTNELKGAPRPACHGVIISI